MEHRIEIERIESIKKIEQCAEMYPAAYNSEPWNDNWTIETATALLTCYYNTPNFMGWVATHNDRIIGCAIGNIEPYFSGDIFILKEIFVAVGSQQSGIGSRVIATVKKDLQKLNIKMVMLFTIRPIFNFYEKSGFKQMEGVGTMIYSYQNN